MPHRYFIQGPRGMLPSIGKAERIISDFGARRTIKPAEIPSDSLLVCVWTSVASGLDFAVMVDSMETLEAMSRKVKKTWFLLAQEHSRFAVAPASGETANVEPV